MDLLHSFDFDAAGTSFKLVVLLAIAGAYVLFELLLLAVEASAKRKARLQAAGDGTLGVAATRLGVEAYRPVTSWTSHFE